MPRLVHVREGAGSVRRPFQFFLLLINQLLILFFRFLLQRIAQLLALCSAAAGSSAGPSKDLEKPDSDILIGTGLFSAAFMTTRASSFPFLSAAMKSALTSARARQPPACRGDGGKQIA